MLCPCVGRANWHLIDTIHGVWASAAVYSLVETAKATHLKHYEYLKLLLTEMPQHMRDTDFSFLEDLLPWSDALPDICKNRFLDPLAGSSHLPAILCRHGSFTVYVQNSTGCN